jgi:hypothetical protein
MKSSRSKSKSVLTVAKAAAKAGISTTDIIAAIDAGTLHAIDVGGGGRKSWRIPVAACERFIKARAQSK